MHGNPKLIRKSIVKVVEQRGAHLYHIHTDTNARMEHGKSPASKINFIEPVYALGVRNLPDWLYKIKLDGYRCLTGNDSSG